MRLVIAAILLIGTAGLVHAADPAAACQTRQNELIKQVRDYKGDAMTKRIIQADIERANRELIEGDADECNEALDHAAKLLKGNY